MTMAMAGARRIRVLVVDDSAVMRSLLRMALETNPRIEVVASAGNGEEALEEFDRVKPDLTLLDFEMPGMNGLDVLSRIRLRDRRVPVIMCSTLTWRGARITLDALSRGATDYVSKPAAQTGFREGVGTLARDLVPKILALFPKVPQQPDKLRAVSGPGCGCVAGSGNGPRVVVIGVSTGGPAALEVLLPKIPGGFALPILIVQHMPRLFTGLLAERLNGLCAVRVREAASGVKPEPGVVDIARGDWHMELARDFRLRLNQNEPENFCRPSVDTLFRTATEATGGRLLGVILTGMGSDGLAGCRAIRAAGGTVFAQDAATSVIWGMPGAVANAGLANKILPLESMAGEMGRCVSLSGQRGPVEAAAV